MDMINGNEALYPSVWEDLVMDFLEMACFLSEDQQAYLIDTLWKNGTRAETLHVYPSFVIDGKMVAICEEEVKVRECWIYYPKGKKIDRMSVTDARIG